MKLDHIYFGGGGGIEGSSVYTVKGKLFDSQGNAVGDEFVISGSQPGERPIVTELAGGGFAVAWNRDMSKDSEYTGFDEIFVDVATFDSQGNAISGPVEIARTSAEGGDSLQIAGLADGNFVLNWTNELDYNAGQTGTDLKTYSQVFDIQVSPIGQPIHTLNYYEFEGLRANIDFAGLADGRYVEVHVERDTDDSATMVAQFHMADGSPDGSPVILNDHMANWQTVDGTGFYLDELLALPDGGFVAAWSGQSGYGATTLVQRFDALGNAVGDFLPLGTADTQGVEVEMELLANGDFWVAWRGWENGSGLTGESHSQIIDVTDTGLEASLWLT